MALFRNRYRIESARHPLHNYASSGWYHIVICTHARLCHFGEIRSGIMGLSEVGMEAHHCCESIPAHFQHAVLDAFIIMPNHVHVIIGLAPTDVDQDSPNPARFGPLQRGSLSKIIQGYKAEVTRRARRRGYNEFRWQARFYDRIIRTDAELEATRLYVIDNPAKWDDDSLHPSRSS
jgi:putative transposase